MAEQHYYYKFRSLQNLRRFIDIILNEQLYASRFDELNDPMEGAYLTDENHRYIIELLRNKKYNTRICSLSKDYRNTVLWSLYADSHQGCCIRVSAKNEKENPTEIRYVEELPVILEEREGKELLSHKSKLWEYEEEVRYFRDSAYLKVNIHEVIFGQRVTDKDFRFYEKLIYCINPLIRVRKIQKSEIYDGFNSR